MAVTAETRNAIIELVVTAYNGAPGTTLLTELVEAADGGASLADIATTLTTSSTFNSIYPTFQTVTEFANEFLDNVVPSASADARAEGVAAIEFVLNSGGSRADVILQAQTFLAGLDETDATFGTPAAAFNNKVEVATYHTVTQEQDGDLGTLQSVLSGVTADDATVTTANAAVDGGVTTGSTTTLTTSVDSANGTAGADTFKGVVSSTAGQTTLGAGDVVDGKAGTDTLEIIFDGTGDFGPVATVSNIEVMDLKNFGTAGNSANLANITGLTQVWNRGSTQDVTVTNLASLATLGVSNTTTDYDVTFTNDVLAGDTALGIVLSGAADGSSITFGATSGTEGVETVNVTSTGKANRIDDIDSDQADFTTLNISGDQALRLDDVDSTLTKIDASALTAALTATISTASSANDISFIGTAMNDAITVGTTTTADTINGGDGTDTLTATGTFGATTEGVEALVLVTSAGEQTPTLDMDKAQSITSITVSGTTLGSTYGALNLTNLAANSTISLTSNGASAIDAASTISLKTATGSSDAVTLNFGGNGSYNFSTTAATANGIETINIGANSSGAVTFNIADLFGQTTDVLSKVVLTGTAKVDIDATLNAGTQAFELDASGLSGVLEMTNAAVTGNTTLKAGNNNNTVITGAGTDTITLGSGNDTVTSGAGADTITLGGGTDTVISTTGAAYGTADKVGGFGGGSAGDVLQIDISDAEAVASVTDLVSGTPTTSVAAGAAVVQAVTVGTPTTLGATTNVVVFTGTTYANNTALLNDITSDGSTSNTDITLGAAPTAGDAYVAMYSDGTDVKVVLVATAGTATVSTAANTTITDVITLTGNSSISSTEFVAGNFTFVA